MKAFGIVTLLSVIVTAAAPGPQAHRTSTFVTSKTAVDFSDCFAAGQDRNSESWWFVPKTGGGTFSNLGAAGVDKPYFVTISDRGSRRTIRLEGASAIRGVERCI
jgi:hypothetical protein